MIGHVEPAKQRPENLLHARLVHAPSAPLRITAIESASSAGPDVVLLTGQDTLDLHPYHGAVLCDRPVLAIDRVRYQGEPVAAVAATSVSGADLTAQNLCVRYAPLSSVTTGAHPGEEPLVHLIDLLPPGPLANTINLPSRHGNHLITTTRPIGLAEPPPDEWSEGIAFDTALSADLPPLQAIAAWHGSSLQLWSTTSDPETLRAELSGVFLIEADQILLTRLPGTPTPPAPGAVGVEAIAAALARRARQPVQLTASLQELGWRGPSGTLHLADRPGGVRHARLDISLGASAGRLPILLDSLADALAGMLAIDHGTVSISLSYGFLPPIAATLDDWLAALQRVVLPAGAI